MRDALDDLKQRKLAAADLVALGKEDRRLLDQFAYRYTRLQDDMVYPVSLFAVAFTAWVEQGYHLSGYPKFRGHLFRDACRESRQAPWRGFIGIGMCC